MSFTHTGSPDDIDQLLQQAAGSLQGLVAAGAEPEKACACLELITRLLATQGASGRLPAWLLDGLTPALQARNPEVSSLPPASACRRLENTDEPGRRGGSSRVSAVLLLPQNLRCPRVPSPFSLARSHCSGGFSRSLREPTGGPALGLSTGLSPRAATKRPKLSRPPVPAPLHPLQVAARACLALGTALQLCQQCGAAACEASSHEQLAELAAQLVAAMQRHASDPSVQAAGLHALLRYAGCTTCRQHNSREQQDTLGAAGVIPAALAALAVLRAASESGVSSETSAPNGNSPQQQQQHVVGITAGLQALQYACAGHAGNLQQLAAGGGMQAVAAAMAAAPSEWPVEEHGLLLMALLACRDGAAVEEQAAAAAAIWQAAHAQVERRLVEVGRAAVWGMARLLQRLQAGTGANPVAAQLVAELQLQGAAVVLAMLQSCDKKVRAGGGRQGVGVAGGGVLLWAVAAAAAGRN